MSEITGGGLTAQSPHRLPGSTRSASPASPGVAAALRDLTAAHNRHDERDAPSEPRTPPLTAGVDVITDAMARRIAMDWHGGQASALYSFGSCGAIDDIETLEREISQECRQLERGVERRELLALAKYVHHAGPRPVIPRWAHGYDDTTPVTVAMC